MPTPTGTFDITGCVEKLSLKDCEDLKAQTDKYDKIGVADTAIRSFAALHPTIVALRVTIIKVIFKKLLTFTFDLNAEQIAIQTHF